MSIQRVPSRGLYGITDPIVIPPECLTQAVEKAIQGGAGMIQYRNKLESPSRNEEARRLSQVCRRLSVPFLVNDDPELARDVGADGVHIGQGDMPYEGARAILGPEAIIGVSCHDSLAQALAAQAMGAAYVTFGRFFPSTTKPEASPAPIALLRSARSRLSIPIVAIGGITPGNGAALIEAGAGLLAAITGLFGEPDPEAAARRYLTLFHNRPSRSL